MDEYSRMYTANSNGRTVRSTLFRILRAAVGFRGSSSWPATRSTALSTPLLLLVPQGNSGYTSDEYKAHIFILLNQINGSVDRWGFGRHVTEYFPGLGWLSDVKNSPDREDIISKGHFRRWILVYLNNSGGSAYLVLTAPKAFRCTALLRRRMQL